jgi:hypothetical protein
MMKTIINLTEGTVVQKQLNADDIARQENYNTNVKPAKVQAEVRFQRNQLLAETDRFALADQTLSDEMRAYRQALRDLPANTTDFDNVVWPDKPAEIS